MTCTTTALIAAYAKGLLNLETVQLIELRPEDAFLKIHAALLTVLAGAGVVKKVGQEIKHIDIGDKVFTELSFLSAMLAVQ